MRNAPCRVASPMALEGKHQVNGPIRASSSAIGSTPFHVLTAGAPAAACVLGPANDG